MAKNKIEITLGFNADTSKAKASLKELEKSLGDLLTSQSTSPELAINKEMQKAQEESKKLYAALQQAVNVDTGKFNLSKFQKSLKESNTSLTQLRKTLQAAGPQGEQTFTALAQSIVHAEVPARKLNKHLDDMLKSLKNTAQWKISSTIIQGLTDGLAEAYRYSQDLNKSLNDIRIVTGYSVKDMDKFAVSANKAAKSLSTTTNEYAKASLIYFQQGLSNAEVEKRTAATIKMANVTGEAAEDVSSYMTAVWNNFADGSKELTHYADVITALGAATASSSEEIAQGLQKFSAVANTVGLSYEYATSALATVVSQTRESADTVGTAFKTIFARLESLSLGDTLDDGTNLTKYSQALATVGVNIKDSNGQLKEMDTILDELGNKWKTIDKDQQMALAQTVAGMRQYNNFIALLDNYDTFKVNLEVAESSKGTLDEQAEIYAESWEAARDKVKASLETIYAKILDDKFFVKLLNDLSKLIDGAGKLMDAFGGLQGILPALSAILLKTFSGKVSEGMRNTVSYMQDMLGMTKKNSLALKQQALEETKRLAHKATGGEESLVQATRLNGLQKELELQLMLAQNEDKLTETQKAKINYEKQLLDLLNKQSLELAEQAQSAERALSNRQAKIREQAQEKASKVAEQGRASDYIKEYDAIMSGSTNEIKDNLTNLFNKLNEETGDWANKLKESITNVIDTLKSGDIDKAKGMAAEATGAAKQEQISSLSGMGLDYQSMQSVIDRGSESTVITENQIVNEAEAYIVRDAQAQKTFEQDLRLSDKAEAEAEQILTIFKNSRGPTEKAVELLLARIEEYAEVYGDAAPEMVALLESVKARVEQEAADIEKELADENLSKDQKDKKIKGRKKRFKNAIDDELEQAGGLKTANEADREKLKNKAKNIANPITKEQAEAVKETLDTTEKLIDKTEELAEKEEQVEESTKRAADNLKEEPKMDWADKITGIASGITGIAGAVSMISSAFSVWSNEDLTGWEKFSSSIMSVVGAAPLLISSFTALTGAIWGSNAATLAGAAAHTKDASMKMMAAVANKVLGAGTVTLTKNKAGETAAVWANNAAWYANPVMWIVGIIMAAVAATALLVVGIVALTKALNADNAAAERANERLETTTAALDEMKTKYEEVKTALENYTTAYDALSKMQEGTEEWRKAVSDLNSEVLDLITKYPELSKYFSFENGVYKMQEGTEEEIMETLENDLSQAQANKTNAQLAKNRSDMKMATKNYTKTKADGYTFWEGAAQTQLGWTAGMTTLSLPGAIAAAIAAPIVQGKRQREEAGGVIEQLSEEFANGTLALDTSSLESRILELSNGDDTLAKEMMKNYEATKQLIESNAALINQNKLLTESAYYEANKDAIENDEYGDYYAALGTKYDKTRVEEERRALKEGKRKETKGEDAAKEYMEATYGPDWEKKYEISNTRGNSFTIHELDEGGNRKSGSDAKQKIDWNAEGGAWDVIAESRAKNLSEEDKKKYEAEAKQIEAGVKKSFGAAGASLSNDQLKQIGVQIAKGEAVNLSNLSVGTLDKLYDKYAKMSDEEIEKIEDANEKAIAKAAKDSQEAWENNLKTLTGSTRTLVEQTMNNPAFKEVSQAVMSQYASSLKAVYETAGQGAMNSYSAFIQGISAQNVEQADEIMAIAGNIDWTDSAQGLIDLQNQLADAGIKINENSALWKEFVKNLENAPTSLLNFDFDKVRTELAEIHDLVDDISFGDIISDEDYQALKKYTAGVKDLFFLTANGYKFIGDSQELQNKAFKKSQQALQDAISADKAARENTDWNLRDANGKVVAFNTASGYTGSQLTGTVSNILEKYGTDEALAGMGWTGGVELLEEYLTAYETAETGSEEGKAAQEALQGFLKGIGEVKDKVAADEFLNEETFELYASQFDTIEELDEKYKQYLIDEGQYTSEAAEVYNNWRKVIEQVNAERLQAIDLYQDEEKALARLERSLNNISKQKDKAFGSDYLKYIEEETNIAWEQIQQNQSIQATAKGAIQENQRQLTEILQGTGITAEYDEDGGLTNAEQILTLAYNLEEEKYEKIQSLIANNESHLDKIHSSADAIQDLQETIANAPLEALEYKIEFVAEINETSFEYLDWQLSRLENKAYSAGEAIALIGEKGQLSAEEFNNAYTQLNALAEDYGVNNIATLLEQATSGAIAINSDDDLSFIQKTISELFGSYQELSSDFNDALSQVQAYFDEIYQAYEEVNKAVDETISLTQHYANIVDIVGEGMTGASKAFLAELSKTESEVQTKRLSAAKETFESLTQEKQNYISEIQEAERALSEKGLSEEEIKNNPEIQAMYAQLDRMDERISTSQSEMRDAWSSALQAAAEAFQQQMESIVETFEESIAGPYKTLERLSEAFEQQSTLNSQYVNDYEKIYKLSKLTRQIEGSMNNAQSIKSKSTLAELQAEITALQESGKKLSEYDLEYLNKKYELKQAEIALEESQSASRTMRLTQDTNGQWGYTYTANTEAEDAARQGYEDKLFALQDYNTQYLDSTANTIISLYSEYSNALMQVYSDSTLTEEEINQRAAEITAYYTERMTYATQEYDKAINNNALLYNTDWQNYAAVTGYKLSANTEFANSFKNSVLGSLEAAFGVDGKGGSAAALLNGFKELVGAAGTGDSAGSGLLGELQGAYSNYTGTVSGIMQNAGAPLGTFTSSVNTILYGEGGSKESPKDGSLFKQIEDAEEKVGELYNSIVTAPSGEDGKSAWWDTFAGTLPDFTLKLSDASGALTAVSNAWAAFRKTITSDTKENGEPNPYAWIQEKVATLTGNKYITAGELAKKDGETDEEYGMRISSLAASAETAAQLEEQARKTGYTSVINGLSQGTRSAESWATSLQSTSNLIARTQSGENTGLGKQSSSGPMIGAHTRDDGPTSTATFGTMNTAQDMINRTGGGSGDSGYGDGIATAEWQPARVHASVEAAPEAPKNDPVIFYDGTGGVGVGRKIANHDSTDGLGNGGYDDIYKATWTSSGTIHGPDKATLTNDSTVTWQAQGDEDGEVTKWCAEKWSNIPDNHKYFIYIPKDNPPKELASFAGNKYIFANGSEGLKAYRLYDTHWRYNDNGVSVDDLFNKSGWGAKFDTGGYTGSWGPEGRLAMLHQKEIVLNADDTRNFLSAIDIVRELAQAIDLRAASAQLGLSLGNLVLPNTNQTIQQEVTIHAEFPNATDRNEIEEAFNSLMTRTSQFVTQNR